MILLRLTTSEVNPAGNREVAVVRVAFGAGVFYRDNRYGHPDQNTIIGRVGSRDGSLYVCETPEQIDAMLAEALA